MPTCPSIRPHQTHPHHLGHRQGNPRRPSPWTLCWCRCLSRKTFPRRRTTPSSQQTNREPTSPPRDLHRHGPKPIPSTPAHNPSRLSQHPTHKPRRHGLCPKNLRHHPRPNKTAWRSRRQQRRRTHVHHPPSAQPQGQRTPRHEHQCPCCTNPNPNGKRTPLAIRQTHWRHSHRCRTRQRRLLQCHLQKTNWCHTLTVPPKQLLAPKNIPHSPPPKKKKIRCVPLSTHLSPSVVKKQHIRSQFPHYVPQMLPYVAKK